MFHSDDPPFPGHEWVTEEGTSFDRAARDQRIRFDERIGIPKQPSIQSSRSAGSARDDYVASARPPIRRRILRTLTRFFVAVLIGVGATLAWQSHGDAARKTIATRLPAMAWLLPVTETKSTVAAPDPAQQLAPLASNLELVRRNLEQLAAKQDQMAQNIVLLQAAEEDIRAKMSFASVAPQPTANPQPKPPPHRKQPLAPRALAPAGSASH